MGILARSHVCYGSQAHCAAVEVESASHSLVFKEDAMLIGFALVIVAVFLCCALLFRLSVHALPLFVAFAAASVTYRADRGTVAALLAATLAAVATIALAQIALGLARSHLARAAIGLIFALPAALAGYHAVHGTALATMPASSMQISVSLLGAGVIAAASWTQWNCAPHLLPSP
jgi:hypothetical protein